MENKAKIKFFRGKNYNTESPQQDGIILINNGIVENPNIDNKLGSIYESNKIVGTTCADKLVLTKDISVAGLSSTLGTGKYKNGDVISAGTSIYDILQNILSKELYPTPSISAKASLQSTLTAPSIIITPNSQILEIGSKITLNPIIANPCNYSGTNYTKISGFSYGYSKENDNKRDNNDTSITVYRTTPKVDESDTYSFSYIIQGFNNAFLTNSKPNSDNSKVRIEGQSLTIGPGTNSISIKEEGISFVATVPEINSYYICSNLGNTSENKKSQQIASVNLKSETPIRSQEVTIIGVYPIFSNGLIKQISSSSYGSKEWTAQNSGKYNNSSSVEKLNLYNYYNSTSFYIFAGFGNPQALQNLDVTYKYSTLLLPLELQIESVYFLSATKPGVYEDEMEFSLEGTIQKNINGSNITYNNYKINNPAGNMFKIKIKK